jgi:hypothetical protein
MVANLERYLAEIEPSYTYIDKSPNVTLAL